jgi:uncharacterized peroxidase-related enzyme
MPHVTPLTDADAPELVPVFEQYERTRGFTPNSVRTMARRPHIAEAFAALNQAVLYEGSVDQGLKMLVATIASTAAGCRYCQAHMITRASPSGYENEKLDAVWDYETSPLFDDMERAALRLAHAAALQPSAAEAHHFDELRRHFDDGEIVEIVATVALFGYLNRWNDTMATELEALPVAVAERHLASGGWEIGKHIGAG